MTRAPMSEDCNPVTAIFWGRFPTEAGQREAHCPTVALYQNEDGEFFSVSETRTAQDRDIATAATHPISGTHAELIEDVGKWLKERTKFIEQNSQIRK